MLGLRFIYSSPVSPKINLSLKWKFHINERPKNTILFFSRPNNHYVSYSLVANYGMRPKKFHFRLPEGTNLIKLIKASIGYNEKGWKSFIFILKFTLLDPIYCETKKNFPWDTFLRTKESNLQELLQKDKIFITLTCRTCGSVIIFAPCKTFLS